MRPGYVSAVDSPSPPSQPANSSSLQSGHQTSPRHPTEIQHNMAPNTVAPYIPTF